MNGQRHLKVLHVSQPTDYGVAHVVVRLARSQVERGWSVTVASPAGGVLATGTIAGGARHALWKASRSPARGVAGEARRLKAIIAAESPDVVHLHSSKAGLVGRLVLRGRIPTVFQAHAWSFQALPVPLRQVAVGWERMATRWTTATICCSEGERDAGAAAGIRGRMVVVPNGIDLPPAPTPTQRAQARAALGAPDVPTVVCVGRLCHQKGQDVLIAAWPAVRREVPDARLVLVGDGPDRDALQASADSSVTMTGYCDDITPWLLASDVVAVPSRYEGLPLALLEAMAHARPIVASAAPGVAEVLGGEPSPGALVPVEDARALSAAIVARLKDPALAEAEARAARLRVAARHDAGQWSEEIAAVTMDAVERDRVGGRA